MSQYPYTQVTGKLKDLFKKLPKIGVPSKADTKWLGTLGYTSSNERSFITILKFIGFVDNGGVPTDRWKGFRGGQSATVMASGLREGYKGLFETYPDAQQRTDDELGSFFKSHMKAGEQAIARTVATFKVLCESADFTSTFQVDPVDPRQQTTLQESSDKRLPVAATTTTVGQGLAVNINIQLTLPESADEAVYEKFFKAMKKHLLSGDGSNG